MKSIPLQVTRFKAGEAPEFMAQAWRLRHRVFKEELGWQVGSFDLLEIDRFDRDALHCVVTEDERVVGYWRSLRTTEPYLLEAHFPMLLAEIPKSPLVWEISRFAVLPDHPRRRAVGRLLVREIAAFGRDVTASRLIAVTDTVFERFVRLSGLRISRIGEPQVVGSGRTGPVEAVVINCDIDAATLAGVGLAAAEAA